MGPALPLPQHSASYFMGEGSVGSLSAGLLIFHLSRTVSQLQSLLVSVVVCLAWDLLHEPRAKWGRVNMRHVH
jgi:hypothetical protein